MSDSNSRSIVKAISWRIIGSTAAIIIAYLVTGSLAASSTIGILHLISNTLLYFIHERIWNKIKWGIK